MKDWAGWTWVSQYIKLDPGTYTANASCRYAADGPGMPTNKTSFAVAVQVLGDGPSYQNWWYVDWYGEEENYGPYPRTRDLMWAGNSDGNWCSVSGEISYPTVNTHTGWIEFRIGFHEVDSWAGGNNPDNISDFTTCNWAMIDDVYLELVPESSSVVALLAGFVGLAGLARRRRR